MLETKNAGLPVRSGQPRGLENSGGIAGREGLIVEERIAFHAINIGISDMDCLCGCLEKHGHDMACMLQWKALMVFRIRGFMLLVKIMKAYELRETDFTALFLMLHEMLVKVSQLDQFCRKVSGTDHLQGKKYDNQLSHRVKLGNIRQKKNDICYLGAVWPGIHAVISLFFSINSAGLLRKRIPDTQE
jgi:hypothetical protein